MAEPKPVKIHLVDLMSQAVAVERVLAGLSAEDKLSWLQARGQLQQTHVAPDGRVMYVFESNAGLRCVFCLQGDRFLFFEDYQAFYGPDSPMP